MAVFGRIAAALFGLAVMAGTADAGSFRMPKPDLAVADRCAAAYRGDERRALHCYEDYLSMCRARWRAHYGECVPQEARYWERMLESERRWLEGRGTSVTAQLIAAAVQEDAARQCRQGAAHARHGCRVSLYSEMALTLRMNRLWAGY